MRSHILIVDDDDTIRQLLGEYLRNQGFDISFAENTKKAQELLQHFKIDLIILDLLMPGETGIEFLKRYQQQVPTIMLSALGDVDDRITGLESGADDYIAKPFEPKELLLRIKRLLKSKSGLEEVSFGKYKFRMGNRILLNERDEQMHLTSLERDLLHYLASNLNQVLSRDELMRKLRQQNERYIDLCIARLRNKMESDPKSPKYLQTVRNRGYVLYSD